MKKEKTLVIFIVINDFLYNFFLLASSKVSGFGIFLFFVFVFFENRSPIPDRKAVASVVHCNCNFHAACHPVESPNGVEEDRKAEK